MLGVADYYKMGQELALINHTLKESRRDFYLNLSITLLVVMCYELEMALLDPFMMAYG